uniref:Glycosyltransferase n=1 Tax=Craspedostauros australis TaxID=1486917 RepID=A0A7R9WLJ0_9STRA
MVIAFAFLQLSARPQSAQEQKQYEEIKTLIQKQHNEAQWQLWNLTAAIANGKPAPLPAIAEAATPAETTYAGISIIAAFNHQNDTHMRGAKRKVEYKSIQSWHESVKKYPEIHGIVFNTMYDESDIKLYTTDHIEFINVDFNSAAYLRGANQSLNNQRFYVIEDYLDKRVEAEAAKASGQDEELEYILLTDAQDVTFHRNPFKFMAEMDKLTQGTHHLFVGSEFEPWKDGLRWQNNNWKRCFRKPFLYREVLNAGIIGGHRSIVIPLVKEMNRRMMVANHTVCDQAVMQQIAMEWYEERIITGYPWNSRFKKEQRAEDDTLAYIRHK